MFPGNSGPRWGLGMISGITLRDALGEGSRSSGCWKEPGLSFETTSFPAGPRPVRSCLRTPRAPWLAWIGFRTGKSGQLRSIQDRDGLRQKGRPDPLRPQRPRGAVSPCGELCHCQRAQGSLSVILRVIIPSASHSSNQEAEVL